MPRKPRQSAFEDWVVILARLPWQACVLLAALTGFGFHQMSLIELPKPTNSAELGAAYAPMIARTAGLFLQVIVPAACLIAAFVSWIGKRRRTKLLEDTEVRTGTAPLANLTWREFEQLVGAHFERLGYGVSFTPDGADGGVDVIARKGSETFLIQCKQWRATQVGVSVVRELFGVMAAQGATGGYVVSIGPFTADARAFAEGRNILLVDANSLLKSKASHHASPPEPPPSPQKEPGPACPKCRSPMVRRVATQGTNQGKAFYGCSTYPKCRGLLPIAGE